MTKDVVDVSATPMMRPRTVESRSTDYSPGERGEVGRLRRANRALTLENEVLRRAADFFPVEHDQRDMCVFIARHCANLPTYTVSRIMNFSPDRILILRARGEG